MLLLHLANKEVTVDAMKAICAAADAELDEDKASAMIEDMKEKSIDAVLAEGAEKMSKLSAGGGGGGGSGGTGGGGGSGASSQNTVAVADYACQAITCSP